jgi:alkylhydroperoxidase family enzyme
MKVIGIAVSTSRNRAGEQNMAFINYITDEMIPPADRVPDRDNIIRIHGIHSRTMRHHYDLYKALMYGNGPLSRMQREMIAVVVSAENRCRY